MSLRVPISLKCYSREVIYRTCYAFTDRAYLWLEPSGDDEIVVVITPRDGENPEKLRDELGNALIDFALRAAIGRETGATRDALMARALRGALGSGHDR